jgi:hypothetical protein
MEFLRGFPEWLLAVTEHWHGWVSGGVLAFGLEIGEKLWKWEISKRAFAIILGVGLLWSVFAAWRDEHHNTEVVIGEKAQAMSNLYVCGGDLKATRQKAEDLQSQVTSQQTTINAQQTATNTQQLTLDSCVVSLGRTSIPERVKISTARC